MSVKQSTSCNNLDLIASHGALSALDHLRHGGDKDRRRHVTCMSTALSTLGADKVRAYIEALLDVLRVADHIHVEDAVLVESVDDVLGRNANSRDEELGAGVYDDGDEVIQFAFRVVIAM